MLPGTTYTPEDIVKILLRFKWLIVVPFVVCTLAVSAWARRLPDEYRSETVIMLVPQRISDSYVKSTVTFRMEDQLSTLQEQMLSRSRLERIITDLNLYAEERKSGTMEDVVQRMRRDVMPIKVENRESFRVSFISHDPVVAQKVTERLASLFMEESLRDRANLAEDTNQFLDSQLEDAKRRLVEHEKRLEEYRRRYSGELPTQAATNIQAIQSLEAQLRAVTETTDRGRERRILLERQIADLKGETAAGLVTPQPSAKPEALAVGPLPQQLEANQAALKLLLLRAKPDHPDVRILERRIRDLAAQLAQETGRAPSSTVAGEPAPAMTPAEIVREKRLAELETAIADIDRDLAENEERSNRLRGVIADYQARLNAIPTRESEMVELTRDYATLQGLYQSLLAKREDSKLAANLERRNIGVQFRILDQATVPSRPFRPNRLQIHLMGAGIGLGIGLVLAGLFEYTDRSFKREEEVVRVLSLPVLALVPIMTSETERVALKRRKIFAAVVVATLVISSAAAAVWWRELL